MHRVGSGKNDFRQSIEIEVLHQHRSATLRRMLFRKPQHSLTFFPAQFAHLYSTGQKPFLRVQRFRPVNCQKSAQDHPALAVARAHSE